MTHLDRARSDLAAAKQRLREDALSLESAQQLETASLEKLERARRVAAEDEACQIERLHKSIENRAQLIAMQGALDNRVSVELAAAAHGHRIAAGAAKMAAERYNASLAEVHIAEAAVAAAVDKLFDDEDIETARLLSYHLTEALRIGQELLFGSIAREMSDRKQAPPQVVEALAKLDLPLLDRRTVAINLWKQGDTAANARRSARRAKMISGESTPVADAAA
jgi:hypothetical protein